MSRPISPRDVALEKAKQIPAAVFDAFNAEIGTRFDGQSATVKQEAIVARLVAAGLKRSEVFDKGWLNVEEVYREVGWRVHYEKPGYNETGSAYFVFEPIEHA